jgi:hypothetical protein
MNQVTTARQARTTAIRPSRFAPSGPWPLPWSHTHRPQQLIQLPETISPESLVAGHGPFSESKSNDVSFVFTGAN